MQGSNSNKKENETPNPVVSPTGGQIAYIPKYMAQAPWYTDQGNNDQLHHQRKDETGSQLDGIDAHYERGKFVGQATKYRKGACRNCGSMTHTEKDCFYPPRKRGAWKTNSDIKPDEYINKELNLSYEGKRDYWKGYDATAVTARQQLIMNLVDKEKARLHAEELNAKFRTEPDPDHKRYYNTTLTKEQKDREKLVEDGEQLDVHISDSDSDSSDDVDIDLNKVDSSKKRVEYDKRIKTSVRDMRIREDTAYYLKDLNNVAADDDIRGTLLKAPHPEKLGKNADGSQQVGDNFVRASDELEDFKQAQLFAWEASTKGSHVHLEAQPTAAALLRKQVEERKRQLEEMRRKKLEQRYGVTLEKEQKAESGVMESERYVEYDRQGNVVRGLPEAIPKSKYEEDVYPGNHTSVWGSWYNREEGKWGYACCHLCVKNAYCLASNQ
ncbi:hypothetical protein WA556_001181, partial [Blastocystis sp. ATCC 50177/Nand II]